MDKLMTMLGNSGLVPILVVNEVDDAVPACEAVEECGINTVEVVLRSPAAMDAIYRITRTLPGMNIGGGTVLSVEQAKKVLDCGGKFIVCPGLDEKLVEFCLERDVPILPGCVTSSEVQKAQSYGLNVLKFFPAFEMGSLNTMKLYNGPFPDVRFVPTGGVNSDNMCSLLEYENVLAVGGAWMFSKNDALKRKDYAAIAENIRADLLKIGALRNRK